VALKGEHQAGSADFGYHRHPETKFLHGEATDSGATQRRHVLVEAIEDIGEEADKWDDEDPITAEDEFTVSYGIAETDREKMLEVIHSVSKRQLALAAHVSTRTIPTSLAEANEMPEKEFRRLFQEASSLHDEARKLRAADEKMVRWIMQQVEEHDVKTVAGMLDYDEANLTKIIKNKWRLSVVLRQRIIDGI
jgi:hypothetical protein